MDPMDPMDEENRPTGQPELPPQNSQLAKKLQSEALQIWCRRARANAVTEGSCNPHHLRCGSRACRKLEGFRA